MDRLLLDLRALVHRFHRAQDSAALGEAWGYDEINLNCGCPSDRVQRGRFGACLMMEPELVRDCMSAMQEAVDIPVTIKTRLGVDDLDSYQYLAESIRMHPDQETLLGMMRDAGLERCRFENLAAGVVALHTGYKI